MDNISIADILKNQQFTYPQTHKLRYNIIELKTQNILLAIRQINSYKAAVLRKVWSVPKGPYGSIQKAHEIKTIFIILNCCLLFFSLSLMNGHWNCPEALLMICVIAMITNGMHPCIFSCFKFFSQFIILLW